MNKDILNKLYFPNLDGLRFIAAALVIIHHIELYKSIMGLPSYYESIGFIKLAGKLGVVLFFVLSGFLIFSLLIREKLRNEIVNIKWFYYRRILRIWPLYFLILLLGFFVFPHIDFLNLHSNYAESRTLGPLLYTFMMPNVAVAMYIIIPFVGQVWSLGIEEQFYIAAPILVNYVKKMGWVLAGIVLITVLLKLILWLYADSAESWNQKLYWFNNFTYSCIAIGGLASYIFFVGKASYLEFIFKKWVQVLVWGLTIGLMLCGVFFKVYQFEIFSVLFAIIVLNLGCNPNNIVKLDFKILNYLGKISYGLYMYHAVTVVVVLKLLQKLNIDNIFITYSLVFAFTILVAALSYKFLETPFLKIKSTLQVYK